MLNRVICLKKGVLFMINGNLTYKWWKDEMANKIVIEKEILDWENPIRGIYGIFIREKDCAKTNDGFCLEFL